MTPGDPRPVWLLDVDGVLNAVARRPDVDVWPGAAWTHRTVATLDGRAWPILTAKPVLDFLADAHESGRAEIRWHTTWQDSAVQLLAPALGLPDWPVALAPEFTSFDDSGYGRGGAARSWWKTGAALRVRMEEHRRLVWTDDDLWAARDIAVVERLRSDSEVCAISPEPTVGLTPADLVHIDQFLDHRRGAVRDVPPVVDS